MKKYILTAFIFCLLTGSVELFAQDANIAITESETDSTKERRSWEFGLGGSLFNYNRVSFTRFQNENNRYQYDIDMRHLLFGGSLSIARELNPYFYLDIQATAGMAPEYRVNKPKEYKPFYMFGAGVQWRLTPYFKSHYVEPYFRVGINYFHKSFTTHYSGELREGNSDVLYWDFSDDFNKKRDNVNSYFPLSLGFGVNVWLNNSIGLGLEGDYVAAFYNKTPHAPQVSAKVIYRIGAKDKREPVINFVEIEKIVDRPVEIIVEKIIVGHHESIHDIIDNITFDFDKWSLTAESEEILDKAANWLKKTPESRFLITGFTDAKGSDAYNMKLSQRRAAAVLEALEKRGVPADMIKSRGVGKRATSVPANASNEVRLGDRKITIEKINKMLYWSQLPKRDY